MKTNLLIAIAIVVGLTAWLVIGPIIRAQDPPGSPPAEAASDQELPSVRYRDSKAQPFAPRLYLRGKTAAARESLLRAEVGGPIEEFVARRGERISEGEVIARIDQQSLPEQLEAAEALVAQREMEFSAARSLQSSGYQSQTRLAETASLLAQARNELAATRRALEVTVIKAPYDGVFNERMVDVGEFVGIGDPIATFLELDPMVVTAEATEIEVRDIRQGMPATAQIGDQEVDGSIRYVSKSADQAVRTYTVEFVFENPDDRFKAGLTADIIITTESELAHKVSPALLFLSANIDGDLGLKVVRPDDTVTFHPTTIIGSADDGVWVSGLPNETRIITVGQGFVKEGAKVNAVDETTVQ